MSYVSSPSDVVVLDLIAKTVRVRGNQLTPSTTFEELGIGSFETVELFVAIEDHFGVKLDFMQFSAFSVVGELLESVSNALPGLAGPSA